MTSGAQAVAMGQSIGDLKELRETVRSTPNDAGAWFALAVAALDAGEVGEARFAFTQSVYLAPYALSQAVSAADLLAQAGSRPEAEHLLRRVLERSPDFREAQLRLGQLLLDMGREAQAAAELGAALANRPQDVDLHLLAATAHERAGALTAASEHLAAVLEVDPHHLEAGRRLGTLLGQLGDTEGAVRCWRRLVARTEGRDLDALTGLGISLSSNAQHDEALQILKDVARRRGRSASTLSDLGMALSAAGRIEEAAAAFERALQIEPQSPQAYCGLGIAYQRQSRWHEAAQAFRATEQLAPGSAVGPLNLGLALKELGDHEGARRALLRAAALEPNDPEIQAAVEATFAPNMNTMVGVGQVGTPTPPTGTPVPKPGGFSASISGDLKSFQLFDVLEFLRLQRKTGSLVVSSRHGAGLVRLFAGAVTSASGPRVKRLGEALVEAGLITPTNLELALALQRQESARDGAESLGSVLLREELIAEERLTAAIKLQVLTALEDMLSWKEGAFSFHPTDEGEAPPITLDLQDIMLKLMRMADERNAGRVPGID